MANANETFNNIKVSANASIKEVLKKINDTGKTVLFVCDAEGALIGAVSDGDIRRGILKTGSLDKKISSCYNTNPVFVNKGKYAVEDVKKIMLEKEIEAVPVIDKSRKIVDVLFWIDVFRQEKSFRRKIDVSVVIMAGGKGTRLDPFTKILPKPLIPVGERPMIEVIVDKFVEQGVKSFYFTLNFKGEMIKMYFDSLTKSYKVKYIWEEEYLGTAGSLKSLPADAGDTFIVSNCDIMVEADYADLLSFHKKNKNLFTMIGSVQHHKIPYGVVHFGQKGKLKSLQEKPELEFMINTGVYVVSREVLGLIPKKKRFDMTDLMQLLIKRKKNIGVYPVPQKCYVDVGQLKEYKEYLEKLLL